MRVTQVLQMFQKYLKKIFLGSYATKYCWTKTFGNETIKRWYSFIHKIKNSVWKTAK